MVDVAGTANIGVLVARSTSALANGVSAVLSDFQMMKFGGVSRVSLENRVGADQRGEHSKEQELHSGELEMDCRLEITKA